MTGKRQLRALLGSLAVMAILCPARPAGWGQLQSGSDSSPTFGTATPRSSRNPLDDDMDPHRNLPESYARMQSIERQKRLVSDTDRLLSLTSQLKASIAIFCSETLTPEMLRQMDEIEKLARSVKNKMRN